jgi:hypothetical protein
MDANWRSLSPDQKMEHRFAQWLSPQGVEFENGEAEAAYKARVTRLRDAIELRKAPDRVPVFPIINFFPGFLLGYTPREIMYDYQKEVDALNRYAADFQPDAYVGAFHSGAGPIFDLLDYKLYDWPGRGVAPEFGYQAKEQEYMKAEEYDHLILDPTDYWLRVYLPRVAGAWEPFAMLSPLTEIVELPFTGPNLIAYGLPPVQAALAKMMEVGQEALRWAQFLGMSDKMLNGAGFPNGFGGATKAPFDTLGDTLRGTRAMAMDMYRRPDKVHAAMERLTPLAIRMGVSGATQNRIPIVFIPLHKGADGFMSDSQFKTFYWPTLRQLLLGLIDEGCVPILFAEGGYNSRLEVITDLPRGKTIWIFDQTDMARAKETIGQVACIMGNVPLSMLETGTPEQVTSYCRQLIEVAGKDGGFILANGAVIDKAKPENVTAMIQAARDFGTY